MTNNSNNSNLFKTENQVTRMSAIAKRFGNPDDPDLIKTKYSTGFDVLDDVTNGGFCAGLHGLGAISSLGKSTFALQIATNMAERHIPVIYFSLEMTALDLTAKVVSRETFLYARRDDGSVDTRKAKTSDMLRTERYVKFFTDADREVIKIAAARTAEKTQSITIVCPGTKEIDCKYIEEYVSAYISEYGAKPVVIVDYLQILSDPKKNSFRSDKQITDDNLSHLKRVADTYDVPIIFISAFNRENYDTMVSMKAFKESGKIEYSCDTLMGLQFKGAGENDFDPEAAKAESPRKLELRIIKQRYGKTGVKIDYNFRPEYNFFEEAEQQELRQTNPFRAGMETNAHRQLTLDDIDPASPRKRIVI